MVGRGEECWTVTLDADSFAFRSIKLPPTEAIDAEGRFQERMEMLETFRQAFLGLYGTFVKLRDDKGACKKLDAEMKAWMAARPSRKLIES